MQPGGAGHMAISSNAVPGISGWRHINELPIRPKWIAAGP